ncbi:hypothetical protein BU23DRAFT_202616 [Bimuria novae-zelandiae CBS 107.79]|uniref:Uncharacterized protein n=1 Tax=Bimuria novae-zelandiae CBS 107.79 TaxID=1447943 RepID=A0A6A5V3X1_9PLEO|nr:hypothetical protein BU23DRAFT_202616 [Bimuria novae-zelandiae CBS 107.79]
MTKLYLAIRTQSIRNTKPTYQVHQILLDQSFPISAHSFFGDDTFWFIDVMVERQCSNAHNEFTIRLRFPHHYNHKAWNPAEHVDVSAYPECVGSASDKMLAAAKMNDDLLKFMAEKGINVPVSIQYDNCNIAEIVYGIRLPSGENVWWEILEVEVDS